MPKPYHALVLHALHPQTSFHRYHQGLPEYVGLDNPAIDVMTDLTRVKAVTIAPSTLIDTALQKMIHAEVRLLLVVDTPNVLLGLITARDIMGEKPVNYAAKVRVSHETILVDHIMTPAVNIQVLRITDILNATVGDIIVTLKEANRQHALVVETTSSAGSGNNEIVRGIFSLTQIGKQLGVEIQTTERLQSFAELGALLLRT